MIDSPFPRRGGGGANLPIIISGFGSRYGETFHEEARTLNDDHSFIFPHSGSDYLLVAIYPVVGQEADGRSTPTQKVTRVETSGIRSFYASRKEALYRYGSTT